jgi:alpha-L-fucosidase
MKRVFLSVLLLAASITAASPKDTAQRVRELQKLKWGMFVCWSFSTFSDKEWTPGVKDVSFFNATGMDTDQWARAAKEAGMGYILFLTKHHDGFSLWDTATTDWKVTRSPLGKDVLAAVRKSCDKYGIKLALYFSEGDWTWPGMKNAELKRAQLRELCTRYGPIEFFWFDHAQTDGGLSHKETAAFVKSIQPDCFVGFNHGEPAGDLRLGELGGPGSLEDHSAAGPYATPGDVKYLLAEFAMPILGMGGRWFFTNPDNDKHVRSPWELFGLYLGAVKHGNIFSLDVGPDRAGRLRAIDERTLQETGRLIRDYGARWFGPK